MPIAVSRPLLRRLNDDDISRALTIKSRNAILSHAKVLRLTPFGRGAIPNVAYYSPMVRDVEQVAKLWKTNGLYDEP